VVPAGGGAGPVVLVPLGPADVLAENDVVAPGGLIGGSTHAVGEEGELGASAAGEVEAVELLGVAEAREDEHFPARRMPALEARPAELGVPAHRFGHRRRDGRNV